MKDGGVERGLGVVRKVTGESWYSDRSNTLSPLQHCPIRAYD